MKRMQSLDELTEIDGGNCVFIRALCWRIKNGLLRQYRARNINFHVIGCEDLVTNPKDRIAQILDYIGVQWREEVLMHHHLHWGMSIDNTSDARAIDQNSQINLLLSTWIRKAWAEQTRKGIVVSFSHRLRDCEQCVNVNTRLTALRVNAVIKPTVTDSNIRSP